MQSVKMLVRQVGHPNTELDIISADDLNEYIAYQLAPEGYKLHSTHYLGEVEGEEVRNGRASVMGYKVMLWFVKEDEPRIAKK